MLALMAYVETTLTRHDLDLSNPAPTCWRYAREAARGPAKGCGILCLGTSLVKNGVLPRVLEARNGLRSFNLAVFNGRSASSYYLFRAALRAGARPRAILIDCQDGPADSSSFGELDEALLENERQWPELLGLHDGIELALSARDARFFAAWLVARMLPSYRARFEVRSAALAALRGESGSSRKTMQMLLRNWRNNQGAQVLPDGPIERGDSPPSPAPSIPTALTRAVPDRLSRSGDGTASYRDQGFCRRGLRPPTDPTRAHEKRRESPRNRVSEAYARRIVRLAAARGITVFWLLPPLGPEEQRRREADGSDEYFTRLASEIQSEDPWVIVLDARRSGYGPDAFWDAVHLGRRGAYAYSVDVAEEVARHLTSSESERRWVSLPRFRPRAAELPLEDVIESRLALFPPEERAVR
jgi:hypothetical protein